MAQFSRHSILLSVFHWIIFCFILATRLSGLLMFVTGCKTIPPMGFRNAITILQNDSVYPNANTCPLELELPGQVNTYGEFKKNMDSAIDIQKEGFGIV
jgi:hypothetical protein